MKRIAALLLTIVMIVTLAGCGNTDNSATSKTETQETGSDTKSKEAGEEKTITVWCWDPSFNIYAMEEAAKIYAGINADVKVEVVETAWEDVQTKITTAVTSGQIDTLPDILLMQDNALAKNIINYPDTFLDLTDSGIDFSRFASFKTALSTVDGKNYAVPFDNGAAITCLRTDLLEQAGFTVDDFKDITWPEFIEKGKTVLEKAGKPMLSNQAGSPDLIMLMMQSAGVWLFNEDGNVNITDNDVLKEVVNTYVELVKSGVLVEVNDWDQYIGTINNSTVAGTINGCWIIGSVTSNEEQSGLWGITNVPKLSEAANATNYSSQGGSSWLVNAGSSDAAAAVDFLKNTFAGSTQLYETILPSSGALATYLPAGESDAYSKPQPFFNGQPIYETITGYASKVPQVSYGVYNYEARDAVGAAVTKIIGGGDMDKALEEAQSQVSFQMGQ